LSDENKRISSEVGAIKAFALIEAYGKRSSLMEDSRGKAPDIVEGNHVEDQSKTRKGFAGSRKLKESLKGAKINFHEKKAIFMRTGSLRKRVDDRKEEPAVVVPDAEKQFNEARITPFASETFKWVH
jgi:hypothetical protein